MGDRQGQERAGAQTADDDQVAHDAAEQGSNTKFRTVGGIPMPMDFPIANAGPSASDRAFGSVSLDPNKQHETTSPPLIGQKPGDGEAQAAKLDAERLLKAKSVTSPQDAVAALDIMNNVGASHRARVIDTLDQQAFDNLLDRLPHDARERLTVLIDASQDPKRKLKMWAVQHRARATNDLQRYKGDFGDPENYEQTDEQQDREARYKRRKEGVDATNSEVTLECSELLKKGDQLTVKDVDDMRKRKDKELSVELEHNVNLIANERPREDGSRVVWEEDKVAAVDSALDKLPDHHVHGDHAVSTFERKANRHWTESMGGQYHGKTIDVRDNSSHERADRNKNLAGVEYTVIHEVGHEVESEHPEAFKKFKETAGWTTATEEQITTRGGTDEDLNNLHEHRTVGDKVYKRDDGVINQHDADAIPTNAETNNINFQYARANAQEHFAELYAMAVSMPEMLYHWHVTKPAEDLRKLREQKAPKATIKRAEKLQKQRAELYAIIRNDIFAAEQHVAAAVGRLQQRGVGADAIKQFKEEAAAFSTEQQIEKLERRFMK